MSIELTQKLVAGTLIVGGLGGGYYALTGGSGWTLSKYHLKDGRELITNWDSLAQEYAKAEDKDLIEGIKKTDNKAKEKIKKWCENKGSTYFTDTSDKTYQSYSLWCLVEANLDTVLTKQGYQWKDEDDKWVKKFKKYEDSLQTFLTQNQEPVQDPAGKAKAPKVAPPKATKETLIQFCKEAKGKRYKYHGEDKERQIRVYCYWSATQLEEASKPAEAVANSALPQPPQG